MELSVSYIPLAGLVRYLFDFSYQYFSVKLGAHRRIPELNGLISRWIMRFASLLDALEQAKRALHFTLLLTNAYLMFVGMIVLKFLS